ncbi:MAG: FAD-binding oxidoreductase [Paracoccaceae bacterium]
MTGFPISQASPVAHDGTLRERADVVVIGGGIIGVMSAWFLAERGLSVVLLEKGRIAGEQSSRNWGWIRAQGRDPAELPIMIEARRIWQGLEAECGEDLGLRQGGVLYLAKDAAELEKFEAWTAHARAHDLDTRLLSSAEAAALLPDAARQWPGGLWTASDCRAEPWLAVPALARAAVRKGVTLRENCAVRGLDIAGGRIAGVITENGRVATSEVVLAGGAWSSLLLRRHGVRIPQLSVRAPVAATEPLPEVFAGAAADAKIAFRRRLDGGYTLAPADFHELFIGPDAFRNLRVFLPQLRDNPFGTRYLPASPGGYPDAWRTARRWALDGPSPFEAMRVLNPVPNRAQTARLVREFAQVFPGLGAPRIKLAWAGMIDSMPDLVPVIDRAAALPGLTIATGMSGHGFGIGPGIGRVIADLVTGGDVGHDLGRFRLSRFSDGTKLAPGPAL